MRTKTTSLSFTNKQVIDQVVFKRSKALRNIKLGCNTRCSRSLSRNTITRRHSQIRMITPEMRDQLNQLRKQNKAKQFSEEKSSLLNRSNMDAKMSVQSSSTQKPSLKAEERNLSRDQYGNPLRK
mmetsp:Transcript_32989/g.32335  ORF Transcript_32989/g.32335 Transcript_32989/m.32335 type:complete len:125 (+) Transcript_32989:96-470(+)